MEGLAEPLPERRKTMKLPQQAPPVKRGVNRLAGVAAYGNLNPSFGFGDILSLGKAALPHILGAVQGALNA
jgi:hypothetical protein